MQYDIITIVGPTACGKTLLATRVADRLGGEIISADSRMVYRGMTIGTGKDLADYQVEGRRIPYHVIDIVEAGERFNVYKFQCAYQAAFSDIVGRGAVPILCGGTGLYVEAVLRRYELGAVEIAKTRSLTIGLSISRERRREKISQRLRERLREGMVDEVRELLTKVPAQRLMLYGLEYRYVTLYCMGEISYTEMFTQLETAIHRFAKRQMTWLRGMEERRGVPIHWMDAERGLEENVEETVRLFRG